MRRRRGRRRKRKSKRRRRRRGHHLDALGLLEGGAELGDVVAVHHDRVESERLQPLLVRLMRSSMMNRMRRRNERRRRRRRRRSRRRKRRTSMSCWSGAGSDWPSLFTSMIAQRLDRP